MIVQPINPIQNNKYKQQTNFKAYMPERFYRSAEKYAIKLEHIERTLINSTTIYAKKIWQIVKDIIKNKKTVTQKDKAALYEGYLSYLKLNPKKLMEAIYSTSSSMAEGKEVEINIENGELQGLTKDNEACIFIMNHDRQEEDPKLFTFFNALLSREYVNNHQEETCPKPKILINKDILETTSEERRFWGEIIGAVGIDAGIYCANSVANGKVISSIVKEIIENKTNLFIFPEGKMTIFNHLDPQWKFQPGVAGIIKSVLKKKEQVKVVPLGFAYKKDVGGINIGKPLYFKKNGDGIAFKYGDIDISSQDTSYTDFIRNAPQEDGWITITENGNIVPLKKSEEFVSGILCESLVVSKKKAAESIKNAGTHTDNSPLYTIGDEINE